MNKVILIGHLGKDAEIRRTQSGKDVATFSVATSDRWVDDRGDKQEKTEWHKVVAWGKTASGIGSYLRKGRQVAVEGKIQTRTYEKDGRTVYVTEVVAAHITLLGAKTGSDAKPSALDVPDQPEAGESVPF